MTLRYRMVLDQVWTVPPLPLAVVGGHLVIDGEVCWIYGASDDRTRFVVRREGWEETW